MHVGWFGCIWVAPHMHLSFKMSCAKILRIYLSEKFRTPQDVHCHMSGCNYIAHRHVYRQNIRLLLTRSCKSAPAPCSAKSENYQLRMRIAVPIRVTSGNWGMRTAFNLEWVLSCNTQMCFCVNNWPSITLKVSANMHGITYTFSITLLLIICHIFYVELVVLVGTGIDWRLGGWGGGKYWANTILKRYKIPFSQHFLSTGEAVNPVTICFSLTPLLFSP